MQGFLGALAAHELVGEQNGLTGGVEVLDFALVVDTEDELIVGRHEAGLALGGIAFDVVHVAALVEAARIIPAVFPVAARADLEFAGYGVTHRVVGRYHVAGIALIVPGRVARITFETVVVVVRRSESVAVCTLVNNVL